MNIDRFNRLKEKFENKKYRDGFVDASILNGISHQIKGMRVSRGMTQAELAEKLGTKQNVISRLENPNNRALSIKTLQSLASALDVGLKVGFVPFSQIAKEAASLNRDSLNVPEFQKDVGFNFKRISTESQLIRMFPVMPGSKQAIPKVFNVLTGDKPKIVDAKVLAHPKHNLGKDAGRVLYG